MRTKITSKIVTKIKKVVTPDLDNTISILRAVSWIDTLDNKRFVISVRVT